MHPCEPDYETLLQIRDDLGQERDVDPRKLSALAKQIARAETRIDEDFDNEQE